MLSIMSLAPFLPVVRLSVLEVFLCVSAVREKLGNQSNVVQYVAAWHRGAVIKKTISQSVSQRGTLAIIGLIQPKENEKILLM